MTIDDAARINAANHIIANAKSPPETLDFISAMLQYIGDACLHAGNPEEGRKALMAAAILAHAVDDASVAMGKLGSIVDSAPRSRILEYAKNRMAGDYIFIDIGIRNPCNYRCNYCVSDTNEAAVDLFDLDAVRTLYEKINRSSINTNFECGGGEPALHPQFRDLLTIISKKSHIAFPTNNSVSPQRYLKGVDASRIAIRPALHPQGQERFEKFVRHLDEARDAGATVQPLFIYHPEQMDKFDHFRELLAKAGYNLYPTPFIGHYQGREYPQAYEAETSEFFSTATTTPTPLDVAMKLISSFKRHDRNNFFGIPCRTGQNSLFLNAKRIVRCLYDPTPWAGFPSSPQPCRIETCGCGTNLGSFGFLDVGALDILSPGWFDSAWPSLYPEAKSAEEVQAIISDEFSAVFDFLTEAHSAPAIVRGIMGKVMSSGT